MSALLLKLQLKKEQDMGIIRHFLTRKCGEKAYVTLTYDLLGNYWITLAVIDTNVRETLYEGTDPLDAIRIYDNLNYKK